MMWLQSSIADQHYAACEGILTLPANLEIAPRWPETDFGGQEHQ